MDRVERILERAESESRAGRIWRAKEILRGAIGSELTHLMASESRNTGGHR